jgi:predicted metalloendopeptidase
LPSNFSVSASASARVSNRSPTDGKEARIERAGFAPIKPELDAIAAVANRAQLVELFARSHGALGLRPLSISVDFDRNVKSSLSMRMPMPPGTKPCSSPRSCNRRHLIPPSSIRANTVRNIDAWHDAFNVQPGDTLYLKPEDRVRLW